MIAASCSAFDVAMPGCGYQPRARPGSNIEVNIVDMLLDLRSVTMAGEYRHRQTECGYLPGKPAPDPCAPSCDLAAASAWTTAVGIWST